MYSSCLICHHDLGANGVLRDFPVGERVAFQPETGRVWAVCTSCGEWNLAPIEDRWEAVEDCQRLYDETVARAGGLGVAIARADAVELIRIGPGAEDELMTLRYGRHLKERQRAATVRKRIATVANTTAVIGAGLLGAMVAGPTGFVFAVMMTLVGLEVATTAMNPVVARIPAGDRGWIELRRRELREARLVPEDGDRWCLRLRPGLEVHSAAAIEAVRYILPLFNSTEDLGDHLRKARNYIKKKGGTVETVFLAAARRRGRQRTARVAKLDPHIRLALEILASEAAESHALAGDFEQLRLAWEHAHNLAAIQDSLLYSPGITRRLRELRG